MRVHKYLPDRLYGFAIDEEGLQVFFHLGSFDPGPLLEPSHRCVSCPVKGCSWRMTPAPPILGEEVDVVVRLPDEPSDKAPRAERVMRIHTPTPIYGKVDNFDHVKGFGFVIVGEEAYHLHKSEMIGGKIPLVGQGVSFYGGTRKGRPRAVHVQVCP
jgi:cold shock CspA family protein